MNIFRTGFTPTLSSIRVRWTTACAVIFLLVSLVVFVQYAHAGVPTYSAGGPADGQTFVPTFPLIDVTASEALDVSTVTTANVTLYPCTGATDASSCASPNTSTNLCNSVALTGGTRVECVLNAPLSANTTYRFQVSTAVQSQSSSEGAAATLTRIFRTSSFDASNNTTPPHIESTTPSPGTFDFSTNGNFTVKFSENMTSDGSTNAVNNANNILLQTASQGEPSGSNICAGGGCGFTYSTSTKSLTINPTSNLSASTEYAVTVRNNITNAAGVALGGGNFLLFFKTGSGADSTAPTIANTFPATVTTGTPASVDPNVPDFMLQFSESMDETTFSTSSIVLFKDDGAGGGTANDYTKHADETALTANQVAFNYLSYERALRFGFHELLNASTRYCIQVLGGESGVKDANGNALASTVVRCFQTGAAVADSTAPTIQFADADNFGIWIQFSEPVKATSTTATSSALNISNYTIQNPIGVNANLNNATFTYRPEALGLEITGIGLQTTQQFSVEIVNIEDRNGNAIVDNNTTNIAQGIVQDSAQTGGFRGGFDVPDFQSNTDFGQFWEKPTRCNPRSSIASKTTTLECEFPVPAALATGSTIALTFPTGFDVSSVAAIATTSSFMNKDLNGPGPGTTTISGVSANTTTRTVTVTLAHTGTAMGSGDQLGFELSGLVNPSTTGEKTITAVIKDASGVKQGQTISFAPFTMNTAGSRSIAGTVCKGSSTGGTCGGGDTGIANVKVFIDSMGGFGSGAVMGGHEEATTNGSGDFSFTGLSDGQYGVGMFIDPSTASDVGGGGNFQMITVSGGNVIDVDFKLIDLSSTGKTLTFTISGGPANTDMDIFCFAPGNFQFSAPVMKKVTTNGSGAVTTGNTIKLQPNTTYECGIGPHIPYDSFSSGGPPPIPDFTFMPPPPKTVNVANADLSVTFVLQTADSQIKGKVTDGSGTGIANVFVDAFPLGCFDTSTGAHKDCQGGFAQTKSDGSFTLNVTHGTYQVSSCAPGMPCTVPVEVTVKADSGNSGTDSNSSADVYKNGTLLTGVGLTIKMNKTSVTIAGQVQDENGNAIKYAFVDAQKVTSGDTCTSFTPTGGFAGSPTDSQGNYTLYVSNGTWRVSANSPSYGQVACTMITVSDGTSKTGQNLKATAADYGTISGTVTKGGSAVQGAQVGCFGSAGENHAVSGSDGTYSMKVKAGSGYTCDGFLQGAGPLTPATNQTVTASQTTTVNLSIGNPGTITVDLGATITDAFCDARGSNGRGDGTAQNNGGVYTIKVPAGDYTVRCGNPKYGEVGSQSVTVTAGGSHSVDLSASAPTLYTVSGRITDGTDNLDGATVTFTDVSNGRIAFIQSDATGGSNNNVSASLPAGTYKIIGSKSGYVDSATAQELTVSANVSFTARSLTRAQAAVSVTVQSSGSNYSGTARVIATDSNGKIVTAEVDKTITSGANTTLNLTNGSWSVEAFADNGKKTGTATSIAVTNNTPNSATASMSLDTAISGFTATEKKQQSITPKNGGVFKDTGIGSNFEVNIPASVLSTSDSNAGTIETKLDPSLAISTPGKKFVGSAAIDITPKDSSGKTIKEFSSSGKAVTIKIPYTDADVTASGVTEGQMVIASWNEAAQEWETLSTTVDTTNNILTAQTTHFSAFAPVAPDAGAPATPSGITATAIGHHDITVSWNTVAAASGGYNIYRDTSSSGTFPRLGSEPTVASGVTSYTDTLLDSGKTYYYKVSSKNGAGAESAASSAVSATTFSSGGGTSSTGGGGGGASKPRAQRTSAPTQSTTTLVSGTTYAVLVGNSTHSVSITSPIIIDGKNQVAITINQDNPVTVTLFKGEEQVVDTDRNGDGDLRIMVKDIDNDSQKAVVVFTDVMRELFTINKGLSHTNAREVRLYFNVDNAKEFAVSHNASFTGVNFSSYATSTSWTLTPGNGKKKVYARFKSSSGGVLDEAQTITLTGQNSDQEDAIVQPTEQIINLEGKLVKMRGSSAVYFVEKGKRRPIISGRAFSSYGYRWEDVAVVDTLSHLSLGDILHGKARVGALIKGSDNKVYFLAPGNIKRWISTEAVFTRLGYVWQDIITVDDEILVEYRDGADIASADRHPDGSLVKYAGNNKVYRIENGKKRWIASERAFNNAGYAWEDIMEIEDEEYDDGEQIGGVEDETNEQDETEKNEKVLGVSAVRFVSFLTLGSMGDEVRALQQVLKVKGMFPSEVVVTGYFGTITQQAVKAFQAVHGIAAVGYVGPQTRNALNSIK